MRHMFRVFLINGIHDSEILWITSLSNEKQDLKLGNGHDQINI